jgi:hypothetical protein
MSVPLGGSDQITARTRSAHTPPLSETAPSDIRARVKQKTHATPAGKTDNANFRHAQAGCAGFVPTNATDETP